MKTPIRLAVAAIVAQAPRLLLSLAGIYGARVSPEIRLAMASVSAVASAAVLTGGCAYLAHAVAVTTRNRNVLALFWALTALATVVILSPEIVAAIPRTDLDSVLGNPFARWFYAIALAAFAELVASGLAVAAASLDDAETAPDGPDGPIALNLAYPTHSPAPPAPAPHPTRTCDLCGASHRDSPQGIAAHARWCAVRRDA